MWPYKNKQIQLSTLGTADLTIPGHPRCSLTETKLSNLSKRSLKWFPSITQQPSCESFHVLRAQRQRSIGDERKQLGSGRVRVEVPLECQSLMERYRERLPGARLRFKGKYKGVASAEIILHPQLHPAVLREQHVALCCCAVFLALHHFPSCWNVFFSENNPKVF